MVRMKEEKLKGQIIIDCLDLLENGNEEHRINAIESIKEFAKLYSVVLNKDKKVGLKAALRQFIINKEGYNVTVRRLYFSLH